jgi:hypothetical protein
MKTLLKTFCNSVLLCTVCLIAVNAAQAAQYTASNQTVSGMSMYPTNAELINMSLDPNSRSDVLLCATDIFENYAPTDLLWRNSETEPHLAVNPIDTNIITMTWHQDRWSGGFAQGIGAAYSHDGGITWNVVLQPDAPRITACSGGIDLNDGLYTRASDPWMTISSTGRVFDMLLITDSSGASGMGVVTSDNDGMSYNDVVLLRKDPGQGWRSPNNDKNTMIVDPNDPNFVYGIWIVFGGDQGKVKLSRTTDGGDTWETAKVIYKPNNDKNLADEATNNDFIITQGHNLAVLPFDAIASDPRKNGAVLDVFIRFLFDYDPFPGGPGFTRTRFSDMAVIRSFDKGKKWEQTGTVVANLAPVTPNSTAHFVRSAVDFEMHDAFLEEFGLNNTFVVRDGAMIPDVAVDKNSGNVYVVWQDRRFNSEGPNGLGVSEVAFSMSLDGGSTWVGPIPANVRPNGNVVQAFLPEIAVADDGRIGIMYYDFRNDILCTRNPDGTLVDPLGCVTEPLSTDIFVAIYEVDEQNKTINLVEEVQLTNSSFDMRQSPVTRGLTEYFPGDYVGFSAAGCDFVGAVAQSNSIGDNSIVVALLNGADFDNTNRQDIHYVRASKIGGCN